MTEKFWKNEHTWLIPWEQELAQPEKPITDKSLKNYNGLVLKIYSLGIFLGG